MRLRSFAPAWILFAAAACTRTPAQLVLHLESDLPLAEITEFTVEAFGSDGAADEVTFPRTGFPQTLGILPPGGSTDESITLKVHTAGRAQLSWERRLSSFDRGRALHLYACVSDLCATATATCTPSFARSAELTPADFDALREERPPADFEDFCIPRLDPPPDRDAGIPEDATETPPGDADAGPPTPGDAEPADAIDLPDAADAGLDGGAPQPCPGWWNERWTRRRRIDLDTSGITASFTDFPVMIPLDPTVIARDDVQPDGEDLRFIDTDQLTALDHDIELFDRDNPSTIWVRIPSIPANTPNISFYLYYGNENASDGQNTRNVWRDYDAVWHLKETATGTSVQIFDSTAGANGAIPHGNFPASATRTAVVGNGLRFDGNDDYLEIVRPNSLDLRNRSFTIELWAYFSALTESQTMVGFHTNGQNNQSLFLRVDDDGRVLFGYWGDDLVTAPGMVSTNLWYYFVFEYRHANNPGRRSRILMDGVELASGMNGPFTGANPQIALGRWRQDDQQNFAGTLDEVRVTLGTRDEQWHEVQRRSMTADPTFLSFRLEERCE